MRPGIAAPSKSSATRSSTSAVTTTGLSSSLPVLTERFSGAIEGIGIADHIRLLHPDGTGISTGIERIEGTVAGRAGSFILTAYGRNHSATRVSGTWTVQPGSGTAELTGLRGRGSYTATADPEGRWCADDEFVCWFTEQDSVSLSTARNVSANSAGASMNPPWSPGNASGVLPSSSANAVDVRWVSR